MGRDVAARADHGYIPAMDIRCTGPFLFSVPSPSPLAGLLLRLRRA